MALLYREMLHTVPLANVVTAAMSYMNNVIPNGQPKQGFMVIYSEPNLQRDSLSASAALLTNGIGFFRVVLVWRRLQCSLQLPRDVVADRKKEDFRRGDKMENNENAFSKPIV